MMPLPRRRAPSFGHGSGPCSQEHNDRHAEAGCSGVDPAPHRRPVRADPPDIAEILMDHGSRSGAAELLDNVGHGVAVADDQGRTRPGTDACHQGRRVGGIVDDRRQPQPFCQRRRGLAGLPVVGDIDDCRRVLGEPVGEQVRLAAALVGEVRIAFALRRVEVANDVENRPGGRRRRRESSRRRRPGPGRPVRSGEAE